ncbi:MAG TPA: plastocyanin/azurin family copper-binding protein [Solirubrobacteraceae bacterium]|jgi:plastocyanin
MSIAAALVSAAAVAPGLAAGSASSSASFTAYDYGWSANGNAKSTNLTIAQGGTVAFSYPTGRSEHNADFGSGPQPTGCAQTAGVAVGKVPPLPHIPMGAGWSGTCSFSAPGIYKFHCDLHPFMTGTVVVEGPAGSPFARKPTIQSPQRGAAVKGSVTLSNAATGGSLEVDLRASAKSLGRRGSGLVRVGRLTKSAVKPGTIRFAVALDAAANRAERRAGRLTVTVEVTAQAPGGNPVSVTRRVLLRP